MSGADKMLEEKWANKNHNPPYLAVIFVVYFVSMDFLRVCHKDLGNHNFLL